MQHRRPDPCRATAWKANGFATDPPNAVLQQGRHGGTSTAIVITRPVYDSGEGTFSFRARADIGSTLARLPHRLGPVALFIDDGSSDNVYQQIVLEVVGAEPGQQISISLSPGPDRSNIAFSMGPPFASSAGVGVDTVFAGSGLLPLTQMNVNSSEVTISTQANGGSSLAFQVTLYLVAAPTVEAFYLQSESDPGIQVTAQIGTADPVTIGQTDTPFSWTQG